MSSSNYIESIHMQILHLNKNYFHSKEESTADLTNNLTNNLKSQETQIKIDKNKVIKKILVEEALDKSLFEEFIIFVVTIKIILIEKIFKHLYKLS